MIKQSIKFLKICPGISNISYTRSHLLESSGLKAHVNIRRNPASSSLALQRFVVYQRICEGVYSWSPYLCLIPSNPGVGGRGSICLVSGLSSCFGDGVEAHMPRGHELERGARKAFEGVTHERNGSRSYAKLVIRFILCVRGYMSG